MNIKIYNKDKVFNFPLVLDEDFKFISYDSFRFDDSVHMSLVSKLWSDSTLSIVLSDCGKVMIAPKKVNELIKKYGIISYNTYPSLVNSENVNFTLLELIIIYIYDALKFNYYEDTKHVFDVYTGEEIEFGSQRWDDIRNINYYNIIKGIHVGRSIQLYLVNNGYNISVKPSVLFLNTNDDGGV